MIKAVLVDGDGVVIKSHKYFSERLAEDGHEFSKEKFKEFFTNVYPDIRIGKKDLKEEVEKYMHDWGWDKSADELLKYWFSGENELNLEAINKIQKLRNKGIKVYIASDHSKYRANDLWEKVGLKKYFDGHFFSSELGVSKSQKEYFKKVLHELNLKSDEVAFFDDGEKKVETAKSVGINAELYSSISQLDLND